MNDWTRPWRMKQTCSGFAHHVQHCRPDELKEQNPKLYNLLMKYGSMFDDEWFYWVSARGGKWIRRTLVFLPKRIDQEKPRRYEPNKTLF